MTAAVIVSTARTPLAKSWKGSFNMTHGATLGGHAAMHAIKRAGIEAAEVEDVIMGCATPEGATGANIARQIALRAGCPVTVPGMTVNRFCASSLQTIALASQRIIAGEGDIFVAGGVEAIFSVLAIKHGLMPPTINYENPDPACDLDYVPNVARQKALGYVMSNSFGFGGTNATLVFKKFEG